MPGSHTEAVFETSLELALLAGGLQQQHGDGLREALLDTLVKQLASRGVLDVLRHGFKFYGKTLECAAFRPAHGLDPDDQLLFDQFIEVATQAQEFVQRALANPLGNFAVSMEGKVKELMGDQLDQNQELVTRYLNDAQFQSVIFPLLVKSIYDTIRRRAPEVAL
jgi:hypothetical protein